MRRPAPTCALALLAMGLLRDITALKPRMTPIEKELLIQEGDELTIECKGKGRLQFSTEWNLAHVNQSKFNISFNDDSGSYTLTRPNATRKDTGWYACAEEGIEIRNDELTIDHPDADISWIYVYVNSSKPFAIDYDDDEDGSLIYIPVVKGRRTVIIPCRPTSPNLSVILKAKFGSGPEDDMDITQTFNIYDPKIGFIMNDTDSLDFLLERLAETFVRCKIKETDAKSADYVINLRTPVPVMAYGDVVPVIVDEALTLDCNYYVPAAGEGLLAYWDIPGSLLATVPFARQEFGYNRTLIRPSSKDFNWEIWNQQLTVKNVRKHHRGDYSFVVKDLSGEFQWQKKVTVHVSEPGQMTGVLSKRVNLTERAELRCDMTGFPLKDHKWVKIGKTENIKHSRQGLRNGRGYTSMVIRFEHVSREDNGTYECRATDFTGTIIRKQPYLIVLEVPELKINFTISGGADSVYLNWTVFDGNDPVTMYSIQRMKNGTKAWVDCSPEISGERTSYVATGLEKNTAYRFNITAHNSIGVSHPASSEWITTLDKDPELFVPTTWINKTFDTSVTISWFTPPSELEYHVYYYKVRVTHGTTLNESTYVAASNYYAFEEFESGTKYSIEVAACSNYTDKCGDWSNKSETIIIRRDPRFIPNISIDELTSHSIKIEWSMPQTELLERVHHYKVQATNSTAIMGPFYANRTENSYVFEDLKPDTSYLLEVAACSEYRMQCWDGNSERRFTRAYEEGGQLLPWVVGSIGAILIFLIMAIWMRVRSRRELAARRRFMEATIEIFKSGARDSLDPELDMAEQAELLPYNKKWEFPRKLLKLGEVLGSGAFGIVKMGEAKSICKGQKFSTVAVKMVRATHRLDHMTTLIRELKILAHLGKHLNIVNLLGACTGRISYGELLVIVEYCRFGNLHDYLVRRRADFVDQIDIATGNVAGSSFRTSFFDAIEAGTIRADSDGNSAIEESSQSTSSSDTIVAIDVDAFEPVQVFNYEGDFADLDLKPIGTLDLLCWAWQISRGMNYLSLKRVVHGDLAARNILLADNNVVKICDFGLGKSLQADDIYKKSGNGPLPVKWMSVEAIGDRVFSIKSDVWSYGIVLWELFALAATPYPGITNENVYQKLVDGFRMERPKYAAEDIYRVMLSCWDAEPSKRPSFGEIEDIIDGLLDGKSKEHYMDFDVVYAEINAKELADGKDYFTMTPAEYLANTAEPAV